MTRVAMIRGEVIRIVTATRSLKTFQAPITGEFWIHPTGEFSLVKTQGEANADQDQAHDEESQDHDDEGTGPSQNGDAHDAQEGHEPQERSLS
jgi:hypothetical protein